MACCCHAVRCVHPSRIRGNLWVRGCQQLLQIPRTGGSQALRGRCCLSYQIQRCCSNVCCECSTSLRPLGCYPIRLLIIYWRYHQHHCLRYFIGPRCSFNWIRSRRQQQLLAPQELMEHVVGRGRLLQNLDGPQRLLCRYMRSSV